MAIIELAVAALVLALVAWVVGARGIAGMSMEIAKILILIAAIIFIASLIL